MKCYLCNETIILSSDVSNCIDSKNFAVKHGDKYMCTACRDIQLLFDDTPNKVTKKQIEPKEKKIVVPKQPPKYTCIKCQNIYEGSICNKCQTINPLFARKKKTKKKKKK